MSSDFQRGYAPLEAEAVSSPHVPSHSEALALTVVIPTFKERENVPVLLGRLKVALEGIAWEAIYVDDHSPDGTSDVIRDIARVNRQVRGIERVGRRGLSSACIEGMMASAAPYIAVMDADLQHDEAILPEMLRKISVESLDVVIGSRNLTGGSMGDFAKSRVQLSRMGQRISNLVCHCDVTDPMSGFFMVEARFFRGVVPRLTGTGFKILVDLLASSRGPRVGEVPYCFRTRELGESKLDLNVQVEYIYLIVDKIIGRWVPTRFVLFVLVGAVGVLLHLTVLGILYRIYHVGFLMAQACATLLPMTSNFLLNNVITFRDRRLRGSRLLWGLITFYISCSMGAILNISFANVLLEHGVPWYAAGISGSMISSVWNYGVNAIFTWRKEQSKP